MEIKVKEWVHSKLKLYGKVPSNELIRVAMAEPEIQMALPEGMKGPTEKKPTGIVRGEPLKLASKRWRHHMATCDCH